MPPLPSLPPITAWKQAWPRSILRYSMDKTNRNFEGRVLLANQKIADDFAKALRIRKGEVIIEAFSGPGLLTRSLLNGGTSDTSSEGGEGNKPALVVTCEPSPSLLVNGLGMGQGEIPGDIPAKFESEDFAVYQSRIYPSHYEPRLMLSPSTPYRWPTLSQLLGNPLTAKHIQKYDDTTTSTDESNDEGRMSKEEVETGRRPWNAPEPPITIVAQMPQSVAGDQMVAQWIGSCAGSGVRDRTWIWQWGRLRLALLVGKGQYDRLMAGPGEVIHCKLSVMTQALFKVSPLPPYHHVFNVDKSSNRIEDTPIKSPASTSPKSKIKTIIEPPLKAHESTTTYPDDFYPITVGLTKHLDIPLPRPQMLGILFEPRLDSPINLKNKDEWDYVLRKCFVTEAQTIKIALKNLAFGAEGLIDKIENGEEGRFKGRPVRGEKVVRDLTVEDWTRVVDVFGKWAFKPANLILDSRPGEDSNRQIGHD